MAHARQQIRDAIVTAVTGLITTGSNVHNSPVYPFDVLPCLAVYSRTESAAFDGITSPRNSVRELEIIIEARAKATSGNANTIDTICAEVETALAADVTLGGLARDLMASGFDMQLSGDADKPTMLGTMRVLVRYRVKENAPEVLI